MDLIERERRALYVASLLLVAALIFDVKGDSISAGGIVVDFGHQGVLYAVLIGAWLWFSYRYWVVSKDPRSRHGVSFRETAARAIDRNRVGAMAKSRAEAALLARLKNDHPRAEGDFDIALDQKDYFPHWDGITVPFEWRASVGNQRPNGRESVTIKLNEIPILWLEGTMRAFCQSEYFTTWVVPRIVAYAPLLALAYRAWREWIPPSVALPHHPFA